MSAEVFFLRFLWGPRQENVDQCADRLGKFLSELSAVDPVFSTWRRVGKNEQEHQMPLGTEQLKKWLAQGVNRRDIGKEVIQELGFSVSLITNEDDFAFPLRIGCGKYSSRVSNTCSIEFPISGKTADRLLQPSVLIKIAKAVIRSWQPDHGVITSQQCSRLSSPSGFLSEAGWITYLSEKYNGLSQIPKSAQVEMIGNGRLILATSERFSSANPDHLNFVTNLSRSLQAVVV